ncbi:hypothetical protein QUH73_18825, partial [Labilibaculum sp. K2S]|uniref:hypothetical protein n=1 Tax=Labilibaculum sp. K2S TaxID=3056386 RepID=UPI0025A37D28
SVAHFEPKWVAHNGAIYPQWFEKKYILQTSIYLHDFYEGMEIRATQELPKDDPNHLKQPLQHAVQLIKRYRDVYFEGKEKLAPLSIILTTLVGQMYQGESSIYETINKIVERFDLAVMENKRFFRQFHISNPVLSEEIFTKEWGNNPRLFQEFLSFMKSLRELWIKLNTAQGENLFELFKSNFGTGAFENAIKEQGVFVQRMRDKGLTGVHVGNGIASTNFGTNKQKDKPNIFHGGN